MQGNFVNRTCVMGLRRGLADYEPRIEASLAELSQARQKRGEIEGRLAAAKDAYVQAAAEEAREATARVVDIKEWLRAGRDMARRQVVSPPVNGRLVDVNTVGSAIGPLEPIVDVVPAGVPLLARSAHRRRRDCRRPCGPAGACASVGRQSARGPHARLHALSPCRLMP